MSFESLPRLTWDGQPKELGLLFHVHTDRGDKSLEAVCRLLSHQLGWELRLEVNGDLQRSQVCSSQDEVLATGEEWNGAMLEKGWTPC
jgi:hypothetical protein